jgi:hypothetical protein
VGSPWKPSPDIDLNVRDRVLHFWRAVVKNEIREQREESKEQQQPKAREGLVFVSRGEPRFEGKAYLKEGAIGCRNIPDLTVPRRRVACLAHMMVYLDVSAVLE